MEVGLVDLWLPIVISAVAVFILSFIANVVLPHHKGDWKKLPNEEAFLETVRSGDVPAGQYMFPYCDMKDYKDPDKKARYDKGPLGILVKWPGPPSMGTNLVLTFIFYLVVGIFVAYLAGIVLPVGTAYITVFRVTAVAAIMAYCLGGIPGVIWFGYSWRSTWMYIFDGIVYALVTAGFFAWLWPEIEVIVPAMPAMS
jgi:hypothetical protein